MTKLFRQSKFKSPQNMRKEMDDPSKWLVSLEKMRSWGRHQHSQRRNPQVWSTTSIPRLQHETKYETTLTRLRSRRALGARNILLKSDSKLVIGQTKGEYEAKKDRMKK